MRNGISYLSIPAIIAGVILILTFRTMSSGGVVVAGGVLFILAGLVNLLLLRKQSGSMASGSRSFGRFFGLISTAASVLLGLSMLIFIDTFSSLVPYVFGTVVALGALIQILTVVTGMRRGILSAWWLICVVALAGASVYLFIQTPEAGSDPPVMITTGISLVFFGVVMCVEKIIMMSAARGESSIQASVPVDARQPRALDDEDL
ncbi:MAG: hypothetical protein NC405_03710 [Odoribacter sp.]|nr:hypothetical protein [Odoribacter sp.]